MTKTVQPSGYVICELSLLGGHLPGCWKSLARLTWCEELGSSLGKCMFSKWLQPSACVVRESVNTFSFFTYLGTGGYLEDTGCFLSNIRVHLARCNGSLSQESIGWWGTWASVGRDKGCGLKGRVLRGARRSKPVQTPTCFPARATLELEEGPLLDIAFAHSHPYRPTIQWPLEPNILHEAFHTSYSRPSTQEVEIPRARFSIVTMAEQILDQIRDVAEGQIVRVFSQLPLERPPPPTPAVTRYQLADQPFL